MKFDEMQVPRQIDWPEMSAKQRVEKLKLLRAMLAERVGQCRPLEEKLARLQRDRRGLLRLIGQGENSA
jgi:hypothetical protein